MPFSEDLTLHLFKGKKPNAGKISVRPVSTCSAYWRISAVLDRQKVVLLNAGMLITLWSKNSLQVYLEVVGKCLAL